MAEIITFRKRANEGPGDLITAAPWEFRRAGWKSRFFIQMPKSSGERLFKGQENPQNLPPHFVLMGGMAHTIQGIYGFRQDREKMRAVYYLAGLIDCMINQVNPLLRTDLIRDIYKRITSLKKVLDVNWYGHMDQVLLPLDGRFFDLEKYRGGLYRAETMKGLYDLIREGTHEMFDVLAAQYIFFTPGEGA
jgi:hypothetical protein